MVVSNNFNGIFNGKTVLITGHTGFKGSWLSIWLKELGANVIGYALDPYTNDDNFVVTHLSEKMEDIRGDIRDYDKLKSVFDKYKPEIVFHLAAQPLVRYSYEDPRLTYETNIMGTVNVLESARLSPSVKVIINITSDKCYENKEWIWGYRENDSMGGYDPYSSSKGCSELITSAYRNSFFNPDEFSKHRKSLASVRAGNVIGGGDWQVDRIIPDCIKSLQAKEVIEIRNANSIRPWQYVLEPLSGYLLLASKMYNYPEKYAGAWNFGPDYDASITVKELVDKLTELWGNGKWIDISKGEKVHEAKLLRLDISKAVYELNWNPKLSVYEALKYTVEWYKSYRSNENMYDLIVKQISDFINENG
jgi:CDP-glucose 4,6-dehydratase